MRKEYNTQYNTESSNIPKSINLSIAYINIETYISHNLNTFQELN